MRRRGRLRQSPGWRLFAGESERCLEQLPGRARDFSPAPGGERGWRAARGGWSSPHDGRDLLKGHIEEVVQDESKPFGGIQCVEHDEQRETNRIGQQRLVFGIASISVAHDRLGRILSQRLLASGGARTQHIEADTRDHCGQPAAEILRHRSCRRG